MASLKSFPYWCVLLTLTFLAISASPRGGDYVRYQNIGSPNLPNPSNLDDEEGLLQLQLQALLLKTEDELEEFAKKKNTPATVGRSNKNIKGTYNLITRYNYPVEKYTVQTYDGYFLGVFRIPRPGGPVVLLMHGLLSSSADYVVLGPNKALALMLHDAGFDVWLCNARGNSESRLHEEMRPFRGKFWDFSWHEIGKYDLPACIDRALDSTGQSGLHYVGHSQGTTSFFVLGSERPEYMPKIKTYSALAPVAYLRDIRAVPLRLMATTPNTLGMLLRLIGVHEFMPRSALLTWMAELFCKDNALTQPLCYNSLFIIAGADLEQLNTTMIPELVVNTPAGAATKQLIHYGQLIRTDTLDFKKYDYGVLGNLGRYGTVHPPDYDLSKVTAQTYLFYSDNDPLSVQSNVDKLARELPNIAADGMRHIPLEAFSHLDFVWANDAHRLVYDDLISIMKRYEAST